MKKHFYLATLLAVAVMFMACNNDEPSDNGGSTTKAKQGEWFNNPSQIDMSLLEDQVSDCWRWDVWCDGTTIGVEYYWGTESALLYMIKMAMDNEKKTLGAYHKKYKYAHVDEETETACTANVWEGAECWLETVTYVDKNGQTQTSQEYCWMPEANMRERHDYYMNRLSELNMANHTYERVNSATDRDACIALNPEDQGSQGGEGGQGGGSTTDYSQYDNTVEKCWTATITIVGQDMVRYIWGTERFARETMDATQQTYTLAPSSATDENACDALNN